MESKLIEFHHFHRTGKRRRGVIHVIVNPSLRKIYVGWSLCNRGAGDYFDPQVGKDIARKRCLKFMDREDSWSDVSPMNTNAVYETGKETIPSYEWQLYMKTGMGQGGVPVSMYNTLDGVAERIYRVINSVERNRLAVESCKKEEENQPVSSVCDAEIQKDPLKVVHEYYLETLKRMDIPKKSGS